MKEKKSQTQPDTEDQLPGDGGAREAEVETAIDKVGNLADTIDLGEDQGKVVAETAAFFLELYKHRPKPWGELSQAEQRDLAAQLEHNAKELVRHVVEAIARDGRDSIRALLESYTEKDGIKATLKVKTYSEDEALAAVIGLHKAQGKHVLITVASADDFATEPMQDASEPDQPALGFEAGSDEHPDDDRDLVEAASDPEDLRDGDGAAFAGENGRVRIDLKRSWIQFLPDGDEDEEANWQDMREAKPSELAAERERTADFAEA